MAGMLTPKRILLVYTILLTACAALGSEAPAPTFDLNPVYTAAARTHSVELTADAPSAASDTPSPLPLRSPTPKGTISVTATFLTAETASPTPLFELPMTPTQFIQSVTPFAKVSEIPCDSVLTLQDVTFPYGATIESNRNFYKEWLVKNTGSCMWNEGYWVVHADGLEFGYKPHKLHKISDPERVWPGETAEITIQLRSPKAPGLYTGTFQLMNNWGGWPFGWLNVTVIVP
jgi:hypothetical protein